jgi:AraC family transcriptional regulator, regulatory protein of adaptative response / methylated-DNA-[protein]-cysteine methyltransferase
MASINSVSERQTERQIDLRNENELWEAVLSRDYRYFSAFFYGVASSKIYCRPTCPSRRPTREHVIFFAKSNLAKDAGYRPCLRCKPETENVVPENYLIVQKICNYIEEKYDSKISLPDLSLIANQSQFHFHRNFKNIMGVTPRQYVEAVRLRHAKLALKRGESARRSTYKVGHNSSAWLYSDSKFGMPLSKYKSGGDGLVISYLVSNCSLGKLLVAGTEQGVCFVCLGDSNEKLVSHLRAEYPKAGISSKEEERLKPWVSEILAYLEGKNRLGNSNLPLDVQATAFQWLVWKELQNIPYGATRSYNEVAEKVGNPLAYRAVANACASNRVPLVIPCHRVVRKNGDLGGYRWGVERKKKLLKMESDNLSLPKNRQN